MGRVTSEHSLTRSLHAFHIRSGNPGAELILIGKLRLKKIRRSARSVFRASTSVAKVFYSLPPFELHANLGHMKRLKGID